MLVGDPELGAAVVVVVVATVVAAVAFCAFDTLNNAIITHANIRNLSGDAILATIAAIDCSLVDNNIQLQSKHIASLKFT